ncbi:MAG: HAD-IB family hydrolase [Candidatus Pacebacteria bacterium]|nr:HAD-IB family hydrolase [Candidatus Paceibacterota bacterium]
MKLKKFAVFDIDGTIFRSSLFIEVMEELIKEGIFPLETKKEYNKKYEKWQNRDGGYSEYVDAMVKAFFKYIKGVNYDEYMKIVSAVVKKQQKQTYKYTRNLIKKLKKDGYFLIAISLSQKDILDIFCPFLGFDKIFGTEFEVDKNNEFTGVVINKEILNSKAHILKKFILEENLNIKDSIAVGDTESDIPMFEIVENPICFNPNFNLYKEAKKNNWKIVVERKDVIYKNEIN